MIVSLAGTGVFNIVHTSRDIFRCIFCHNSLTCGRVIFLAQMSDNTAVSMRCNLWEGQPARRERDRWKNRIGSTFPPLVDRDAQADTAIITGRIKNLTDPDSALRTIRQVVRVFCSSTFTDTFYERNFFLEDCAPYLRAALRQRGLEFIFSEMRFGIRDDASDKNLTSEICMTELENCKDNSAAAFYILLACDKYGFRPLPLKIEKAEFESLCNEMDSSDQELVKRFYDLDENSLSSEYVLRSKPEIDCQCMDPGVASALRYFLF